MPLWAYPKAIHGNKVSRIKSQTCQKVSHVKQKSPANSGEGDWVGKGYLSSDGTELHNPFHYKGIILFLYQS
jgi:hypothetical protein